QAAAVRAENLKTWSVKTYKCTKQILSERLGKGSKTVDLELEAKIEILRDTKRKYENLLALSKVLANHFTNIIQTQKVLGEAFAELSAKSQELQEEFRYNAETQHVLSKNGEKLLTAINFFISGVTTLCSKTMDDSLLTVKRYEASRLEFDAYRNDLEMLNLAPRTEANILKLATAQTAFNTNKAMYDKLRSDVTVKLQFLDENRVKVMQKQLLLFHNAISAYFAGNQHELDAT
uniref:AH domain-containing protein n=1 Tax=Ciona savignyi TaxID=51511 RepID=H2YGM3_CIOSA